MAAGIILNTTFPSLVLRRSWLRACSEQWIALTFVEAAVLEMCSLHAVHLLVRSAVPCAVPDNRGATCL